ncbi:BAX inhibitor (BI)-1/YccA family protein, partial [Escherichia coli]|nr:BAX inhibitor (BI)-1/YccA family protein [Escherichia coli]
MQKYFVCVVLNLLMVNINVFFLRTTKRMESFSQNSNKLDFQHEARILNG